MKKPRQKLGHTGTLFKRGGKFYWSLKFDNCQECRTVNFLHKGKGLCTSCWHKKRNKNPERKKAIAKSCRKRREKTKDNEVSKMQRKKSLGKRYDKNKEIISLIKKANYRIKTGKPCMIMRINGIERFLPFEGIDSRGISSENEKQMMILKEYYEKLTK